MAHTNEENSNEWPNCPLCGKQAHAKAYGVEMYSCADCRHIWSKENPDLAQLLENYHNDPNKYEKEPK